MRMRGKAKCCCINRRSMAERIEMGSHVRLIESFEVDVDMSFE